MVGIERAIVGTVLLDPEGSLQFTKDLSEDDFSQPRFRILFKAIRELQDQGKLPDSNSVIARLEEKGLLEKVGGRIEILRMMEDAVTAALLPQYVSDLKKASVKRKVSSLGQELEDPKSLKSLSLEDVRRKISKILPFLASEIEEQPLKGSDTNFELRWKIGSHFVFAHVKGLKEHADQRVTARLDIRSTFPMGPEYLYQGQFNFLAPRSQTTLINMLSERLPVLERGSWEKLVTGMVHEVLKILDEGNPVVEIKPELAHQTGWIINPLVPVSDPAVFFGLPGSGKSYLVQAIALAVSVGDRQDLFRVTSPRRVLYLDWETSQSELAHRLATLSRGLGIKVPEFYYRRCARPLEGDVERIRTVILEKNIEFLVIDSLGPACGADLNAPEPAIGFFNALRSLGLPAVITAHAPKNGERKSIYGSVFFEALARTVYEVVRYPGENENSIYVGLYHRKSNLGKLQPPQAFLFRFLEDEVTCSEETVQDIPEAQSERPLRERIYELLTERGAMTVKDIAEVLNSSVDTVSRTLRRMRDKRTVIKLPSNSWAVRADDLPPF